MTTTQSHPRYDPDRRDRIIDACLEVIAEHGVAGTTHRRVAKAAGVPLGSMTYHFDGMGDLLHCAFSRFASGVAARFEERMTDADDPEEAVVALITEDVFRTRHDLVLTHELYTLAAREAEYRTLTSAWMASSRTALERHFDAQTSRMLDALIEGLTIHRALELDEGLDEEPSPGLIRTAVHRITRID